MEHPDSSIESLSDWNCCERGRLHVNSERFDELHSIVHRLSPKTNGNKRRRLSRNDIVREAITVIRLLENSLINSQNIQQNNFVRNSSPTYQPMLSMKPMYRSEEVLGMQPKMNLPAATYSNCDMSLNMSHGQGHEYQMRTPIRSPLPHYPQQHPMYLNGPQLYPHPQPQPAFRAVPPHPSSVPLMENFHPVGYRPNLPPPSHHHPPIYQGYPPMVYPHPVPISYHPMRNPTTGVPMRELEIPSSPPLFPSPGPSPQPRHEPPPSLITQSHQIAFHPVEMTKVPLQPVKDEDNLEQADKTKKNGLIISRDGTLDESDLMREFFDI